MSTSRVIRRALVRSLEDDILGIAKAGAYSAILTIFPALMVLAAVLAASHLTKEFLEQIAYTLGYILPEGPGQAVQAYFERAGGRPTGLVVTTSLATLWAASGVTITWMEGFRMAYQLPRTWGIVKARLVAIMLVILALVPMGFASLLVAFGDQIKTWLVVFSGHEAGLYIVVLWTAMRWLISAATSVAVIAVVYHFGVPRTQPWHSVLPGAAMATAIWFPATLAFGWYMTHVSDYNRIYGSLGAAIVLMMWLYIVTLIVLFGAEINAQLYPRILASQAAA